MPRATKPPTLWCKNPTEQLSWPSFRTLTLEERGVWLTALLISTKESSVQGSFCDIDGTEWPVRHMADLGGCLDQLATFERGMERLEGLNLLERDELGLQVVRWETLFSTEHQVTANREQSKLRMRRFRDRKKAEASRRPDAPNVVELHQRRQRREAE